MHQRIFPPFIILLAVLLLSAGTGHAAEQLIGTVVRLQGSAEILAASSAEPRPLAIASPVYMGDVVSTGSNTRAEVALHDGTRVILGAETLFEFEKLDLDTAAHKGSAVMRLLSGAFLFASGRITQLDEAEVTVRTPLASIGIRGTTFWGGFLDPGDFGVFLFSGRHVSVANDKGAVMLAPGTGTNLAPGTAPSPTSKWAPARLQRAVDSVTFE